MKSARLTKLLFLLYAGIMLWLLFFQRIGRISPVSYREALTLNLNPIPFRSIVSMIRLIINRPSLRFFALRNLFGNIILFIPLGYFLPAVLPRFSVFWRFILLLAGIILAVEGIQFFTLLGSCDVDDLILNLLGGSIGFLLFRALRNHDKRQAKKPSENH